MEPTQNRHPQLANYLAPFKSRLLRVGSDGHEDFALIQEMHPIESAVFNRAITEFTRRVQTSDDTVGEAYDYLGATLYPWVQAFLDQYGLETSDTDWDQFRNFTRPWAKCQLASCCAATISALISDYHNSLREPVITADEQQWLGELDQQIQQFSGRSEAQRLLAKLKSQYDDLMEAIESRVSCISATNARGFTHLLNTTSNGSLTDGATAAIILRGNDSPAARVVKNPLQILDVGDVAAIYDLTSRQLTNQVSKLRNQAMKSEELGYFPSVSRPQQLWQRCAPPKGAGFKKKKGEAQ